MTTYKKNTIIGIQLIAMYPGQLNTEHRYRSKGKYLTFTKDCVKVETRKMRHPTNAPPSYAILKFRGNLCGVYIDLII